MTLHHEREFFDALRDGILGPTLSAGEVDGVKAILTAGEGLQISWVAYMLATAYLETAHTMQPIHEFGGPSYFKRRYDIEGQNPNLARRLGNINPGDGVKYAGRGYVQLTGRSNYFRAEQALDQPLLTQPDLALRADIAAKIMRRGMVEGWFTGKKLSDFLPAAGGFVHARRIINGTDRAEDVAGYARQFQSALVAGGWR